MTVGGPADPDQRVAWVAGATGRLGDALVEQVLASGRYRRVSVLAPKPMATTVAGFEAVDLATLQARLDERDQGPAVHGSVAGPARCDDCYLLLDPDARQALAAAAQAQPRRSALPPFEPLTDGESALALARLAARAGARRLLLLAPLQAWHQLSSATRLLPDGLELDLARLPIPLIIVMKPTGEAPAHDVDEASEGTTASSTPADASSAASPAGRWQRWPRRMHRHLHRFSRFYLRQLRFMLPTSNVVIRSVDLARLAVERITGPETSGLKIVDISWIEQRLRDKRGQHHPPAPRRDWRPRR